MTLAKAWPVDGGGIGVAIDGIGDDPNAIRVLTLTTDQAVNLAAALVTTLETKHVAQVGDSPMLRHLTALFQRFDGGAAIVSVADILGIDYLPVWEEMAEDERAAWSAIAGATAHSYLLFLINRPVLGLALAATLQGVILNRAIQSPN